MATEIRAWQIVNGDLEPIEASMVEAGRKETEDFEQWITRHPVILGQGIAIIGEQISTKSGPLDLLGIDKSGNLVVVELKRDRLPREALAQAVDYASDVATWDVDKISEVCVEHTGQSLEDYLNESFEDVDLEDLIINKTQRILLVGFSVEESLQRMIEWLSNNYGVSINAAVLKYIKTKSGDELIARTMIISEEVEKERAKGRIQIRMSDEPGNYEDEELRDELKRYLSENRLTPRRIREVLLPLCLRHDVVTREMIKQELVQKGEADEVGKAGIILTTISRELAIERRGYLRQIIRYDKVGGERENYRIEEERYKELVIGLVEGIKTDKSRE